MTPLLVLVTGRSISAKREYLFLRQNSPLLPLQILVEGERFLRLFPAAHSPIGPGEVVVGLEVLGVDCDRTLERSKG